MQAWIPIRMFMMLVLANDTWTNIEQILAKGSQSIITNQY